MTNNVVVTLVGNIIIAGISFLTGLLTARFLGPSGRGELAAIQTIPTFLATLAVLGLPEAIVFFCARKPQDSGKVLMTAMIIANLSCIPILLIGYFLLPRILFVQSKEVIFAAQCYLLILPISASVGMIPNVFRGRSNIVAWNILRILTPLMWLLVICVGIIGNKITSFQLARNFLIGSALLSVPFSLFVHKMISKPHQFSISLVKPMLGYGLPVVLSYIPYTLNLRFDQMLMSGIFKPELLGYYTVAVGWSSLIHPFISALPAVMMPHIASITDPTEQKKMIAQLIRVGSLITIIVCLMAVLLTPLLFPVVFGNTYRSAIPAAIILSIAAGFFGYTDLLGAAAQGIGKTKMNLTAQMVGLIFTGIFLWLLLPSLQIMGAALASMVSYAISFFVLLILLQKQTAISYRAFFIPTRHDFTVTLNQIKAILLFSRRRSTNMRTRKKL